LAARREVRSRGASRRRHGGDDPGQQADGEQQQHLRPRDQKMTPSLESARAMTQAKKIPSTTPTSTTPTSTPIAAVITLSSRIRVRACPRVMPTALSLPSSRMRSWIESVSVLAIPSSAINTLMARSA
jgi:hypothetical protein